MPSRPNSFAVWRRLHLLFGSSSSSVGSSGVGRGRSSVGSGRSSSVSSGVGGGVGSSFGSGVGGSSFFSLLAAGRQSESGAGSGSSENDLAHECIP
ncbi:MAG: hypothetical protein RLZZ427_1009 [Pseudomonadota bacterium]